MRHWLVRITPALRLARVSVAFAAIANVWFVILWSRASIEEPGTDAVKGAPLWLLLAGGAANALGLFAFATTFNDLLDWRRDRATHPERPIPAGRMTTDQAATLVTAAFGLAVLGATVLGMTSVLLTLLVGGAILFFNAMGKYVPGVGLVVLGLIYAGQMVVPNLELRFVWPVWLVMTHALAVGALVHIVGRKTPTVSFRAGASAVAGWLFWTLVILGFGYFRSGTGEAGGGSGSAIRGRGVGPAGGADAGGGAIGSAGAGVPGAAGSDGAEGAVAPLTHGAGPIPESAATGGARVPGSGHHTLWPDWVDPWAALWMGLLVAAFVVLAWRKIRSLGLSQRTGEKLARYGALWLALYSCAWLASQKHWTEAAILGGLTVVGLVGMTLLREIITLLEHPVGYRR